MNDLLKPIICCGLTPCIQRIIEFDQLEKNRVNRASRVTIGIGGKGANTARMVTQLGGRPVLIGFAGGANGRLLEEMLNREGVFFQHVETQGETRICQTLVETGEPESTELVEEMPPLCEHDWDAMVTLFESMDLLGAVVPLSGKLPVGAPVDAYAQFTKMVTERGGRVILDAPGEPLLLALEHNPFVVKINDVELLETIKADDVTVACQEIIQRGAQSVLITRGSRTAFYMDGFRRLEIVPPKINAVNPVGSGDAVTAGIAMELSREREITEAIITGMACGAANALNLLSGFLEPEEVELLRRKVKLKPLS